MSAILVVRSCTFESPHDCRKLLHPVIVNGHMPSIRLAQSARASRHELRIIEAPSAGARDEPRSTVTDDHRSASKRGDRRPHRFPVHLRPDRANPTRHDRKLVSRRVMTGIDSPVRVVRVKRGARIGNSSGGGYLGRRATRIRFKDRRVFPFRDGPMRIRSRTGVSARMDILSRAQKC